MRFTKCDFCEKIDFQNVNFVKIDLCPSVVSEILSAKRTKIKDCNLMISKDNFPSFSYAQNGHIKLAQIKLPLKNHLVELRGLRAALLANSICRPDV